VARSFSQPLRHRWTLLKDADVANLPRIARMAPGVDFLHYDSDKRYESRQFALDTLSRKLSPGASVMFDDIEDNWHFRDTAPDPSAIFGMGRKFVGLWGGPVRASVSSPFRGRKEVGGTPRPPRSRRRSPR
jgi:hypothetical protein